MSRRSPRQTPRPFLKWAGGKRSLLERILPRLPHHNPVYVEPFLGGGAVFLSLARAGRIGRAILADRNPELVNTWRRVRDEPDALIQAIEAYGPPTEEHYYAVRAAPPETPLERAAWMLWLNRTCYNGLYRLNRSGGFNVPYGRYKRVTLVDADNIRAVSEALHAAQAEIIEADFRTLRDEHLGPVSDQLTVYCDPPYLPRSPTASFTAYDRLPFALDDHEALARWFAALKQGGARGLLSNAWTPESRALYDRFELDYLKVFAPRPINRNAAERGRVAEVLVYVNVARTPAPNRTRAAVGGVSSGA